MAIGISQNERVNFSADKHTKFVSMKAEDLVECIKSTMI